MNKYLTLVPVGGLGNRIQAICSAISFCQMKKRHLKILWFKDGGLNCDYNLLFDLKTKDVTIDNATCLDFILRDNPRKKNLWIPAYFQKRIFDKCIYYYKGDFNVINTYPPYDDQLDEYNHIYLVACNEYWLDDNMYQNLLVHPKIEQKVQEVTSRFTSNAIGIHIRRTDNWNTVKYSPTQLFIDAMHVELAKNPNTIFYLASDSLEEKMNMIHLFGEKIITSVDKTSRDSKNGIIDAFVEMNILSRTKRIYAGKSSFAYVASRLTNNEYIELDTRTI